MVERKIYMDKIKKLQDQQIIKVVTGVRRCGKSTLHFVPTAGNFSIGKRS